MDSQQITKPMIQFSKAALDISFSAMTIVAEQNEKMIEGFFTQAGWQPEEGKHASNAWMPAYRNGCHDFKRPMEIAMPRLGLF